MVFIESFIKINISKWKFMQKSFSSLKKQQISIRIEQSYSIISDDNPDNSHLDSVNSISYNDQHFSRILHSLIEQERKKTISRKTEQFHRQTQISSIRKSSLIKYTSREGVKLNYQIEKIIYSPQFVPNYGHDQLSNAIYGAFFGFIIGDSIGAHVAYQSENLLNYLSSALLMNKGGTYELASGQGTDETEIMLSTAYGLIECQNKYCQRIMSENYIKWLDSKPFDLPVLMALSFSEVRKLNKMQKSEISKKQYISKIKQASLKNSRHESNLGLIRIIPLVVWGINLPEPQFDQLIQDELQLICPNTLVLQTGAVYAKILRSIILNGNQQKAFFEAAKWVYQFGSQKMVNLWQLIEQKAQISSRSASQKLKSCFSFAMLEINRLQMKFQEILSQVLLQGGDTDSNCAIVMGLIGAILGYNGIPSYYRKKIIEFNMKNSPRPRDQKYSPNKIIQIIPKLLKYAPTKYVKSI